MPSFLRPRAMQRWSISQHTRGRSVRTVVKLVFRVTLSKFYLRRCTRVGELPRVWGAVRIRNQGFLTLGNRIRIRSTIVPVELVARPGGRLQIGDRVYINYGTSICAYHSIDIGPRCLLGTYVNITDNDQHDLFDRDALPPSEPVRLEEDAWLGDRVIVLKGVTIGRGAVVGAGSVVTRDVPPYSIAAGVPARVLRRLDDHGEQGHTEKGARHDRFV